MVSEEGKLDNEVWKLIDQKEEWSAFSIREANRPDVWISSVVFQGIYCAACGNTIEDLVKRVPGVLEIEINTSSRRAKITWSANQTTPSRWMRAAEGAGYIALPSHDMYGAERQTAETRRMLWRLGVAGICMMQVMMYATPSYVQMRDIPADLMTLLRWAQWILSVPVLLFSCAPFFHRAWQDLKSGRIGMDVPVSLGMLLTFGASTLGTFDMQGPFGKAVYFDSFTMFVFFLLLGRWLELRMRDHTSGSLDVALSRLPDTISRKRPDGSWERVGVRQLAVGNEIRILPAEKFPADGILLEGETEVDEALLTGESHPVFKKKGATVIAGAHNLTSPVIVAIQALGQDTRYGQMRQLIEAAAVSRPHIAKIADKLATPFLIFIMLCAAGAGWWWRTEPSNAVMIAVAILVVTCPCAISLATPVALLSSAGVMARKGVLVKNLDAIEALAKVDTIFLDKTGTLTEEQFQLIDIRISDSSSRADVCSLAAGLAAHSHHPLSKALQELPDRESISLKRVTEHPGKGIEGLSNDEEVFKLGSASFTGSPELFEEVGPVVYLSSDRRGWLGAFQFRETLRQDASEAIENLRTHGVDLQIMSGDALPAVQKVAGRLNVDTYLAAQSPADKLAALQQARTDGRHVAMVGDGLNDAASLAAADAAFAFGSGVALTQVKADFVLSTRRVNAIWETFVTARHTMRVVRQNLGWALLYNVMAVPAAIVGWMPPWAAGLGMAFSSLFVVINSARISKNSP